MSNFFTRSISRQLTFGIAAVLFIILLLSGFFILNRTTISYNNLSDDYLNTTVNEYSESTSKILSLEYSTCSTLKQALDLYEELSPEVRRE